MKRKYRLLTYGVVLLAYLMFVPKSYAQDPAKLNFDKVEDVITVVNGEPFAIHVTGINYGNSPATALPIDVRHNNPELIDKFEINGTSNGNAFIQYSLKENATGSAIFTVEIAAKNAANRTTTFNRSFTVTVNSIVVETVNLKEKINGIRLQSYPNPLSDEGFIVFSTPRDEHIDIQLFDVNGRKVKQLFTGNTIANRVYQLELLKGQLNAGIYFLQLNTPNSKKNVKLAVSNN